MTLRTTGETRSINPRILTDVHHFRPSVQPGVVSSSGLYESPTAVRKGDSLPSRIGLNLSHLVLCFLTLAHIFLSAGKKQSLFSPFWGYCYLYSCYQESLHYCSAFNPALITVRIVVEANTIVSLCEKQNKKPEKQHLNLKKNTEKANTKLNYQLLVRMQDQCIFVSLIHCYLVLLEMKSIKRN